MCERRRDAGGSPLRCRGCQPGEASEFVGGRHHGEHGVDLGEAADLGPREACLRLDPLAVALARGLALVAHGVPVEDRATGPPQLAERAVHGDMRRDHGEAPLHLRFAIRPTLTQHGKLKPD